MLELLINAASHAILIQNAELNRTKRQRGKLTPANFSYGTREHRHQQSSQAADQQRGRRDSALPTGPSAQACPGDEEKTGQRSVNFSRSKTKGARRASDASRES